MTTPLTRDVKALSAILISGVVELACAAGLQNQRTRVVAGWASAALLLAVYPANLKMTADLKSSHRTGLRTAAFARLPLQVPLIRSAVRAARG